MKTLLLWIGLGLACPHGTRAGDAPSDDKGPVRITAADKQRMENAKKERLVRAAEARKFAEAQTMLRVSADPSTCVASHNQRGDCLLTAETFNLAASSVEPDSGLGDTPEKRKAQILAIRMDLLRTLLEGEYLLDKLHATGLENEVLKRAESADREKWALAVKSIGEGKLRELYSRYQSAFVSKERQQYQVLVSTDSLRIDSLFRLAQASEPILPGRVELPWVDVPDSLLPPELGKAGVALKKSKNRIRVSWTTGFACLRLASAHRTPAISFQEAIPTLIALTPMVAPDSLSALKEAREYYRANPTEFKVPDTLVVMVELFPGTEPQVESKPANPRRLTGFDLPPQVQLWLAAQDSLAKGKILGPVFLGIGVWKFQILEIKKGVGLVPIEIKLDSLLARLKRDRMAQDVAVARQGLARKERNLGLRIFQQILDEKYPIGEAAVKEKMEADSAEVAGMLPKDATRDQMQKNLESLARAQLRQAQRDMEYAGWLRTSVTLAIVDEVQ